MSDQTRVVAWMTSLPGTPAPTGSIFEAKPGGALRIIFPNRSEAKGSVVEVDPPHKLVFTWGYEPDVAKTGLRPGSSRVEIVIRATNGGTLVTLTHSGPMSEKVAKDHESGWRHHLSQLAVQCAMEAHQAHLATTIQTYFAASMEPDQPTRDSLLSKCCEPDIRVRTQFACTDTIAEFSGHIANGLKHMPGVVLAQDGVVRHLHGYARIPWKVATPEGKAIFKGENIVRFTPGGKIAEVVSFPG